MDGARMTFVDRLTNKLARRTLKLEIDSRRSTFFHTEEVPQVERLPKVPAGDPNRDEGVSALCPADGRVLACVR